MWRQVDETEMVAVLVDTLIAERLWERKLVYQSLNMTLNVTIDAMSPEVQHAAGEYQASVRALTFGLPILSGVVIIVAIICFIIRLRDGMRGISKIETLARLALLFIVCACVCTFRDLPSSK
jgi:Mn2+/Fe2+ NRAMP family transporter